MNMIPNKRMPKYVLIFLSFFLFNFIWGAKAPSSKQQLETIATHIVVGKVQAVYSYKEREGIPLVSGYEYDHKVAEVKICLLYTSPSPRDQRGSRMPSSA